ncbi:MAG: glycosyltransferase, partial [bacterium]
QYMALGIPTVATAIGTNFRVIENDQSGLLVKTDEQWIEALFKLIDTPSERRRLGQAARQRVEKYYSIEANKDVYLAIFDKVYGAPAGWPRPEGLSLITPLEKAGLATSSDPV